MSDHSINIVRVGEVQNHPDADRLEITHVWGWQCVILKESFKQGDRAVYIPPDFVVPTNKEPFAFLKSKGEMVRIKVLRMRGKISQGLLIPLPDELKHLPDGADVRELLGIIRYEPPVQMSSGGDHATPPDKLYTPVFDVENYERWGKDIFKNGEIVCLTEKVHGSSARYVFAKNIEGKWEQFCGSRQNWIKKDSSSSWWWRAFEFYPSIGQWCESNPEKILYGEVFGPCQSLKYGSKQGQIFFAAFSIMDKNRWLDFDEFELSCKEMGVPTVPVLYKGPFDETKAKELAEEDSSWIGANHFREGIVILPIKERSSPDIGRVILKMVSNNYLSS